MRFARTPLALATVLALASSLAFAGLVAAAETTLTATLAGDAETDEDGSGTATVVLDPEAGTACWEMSVEEIAPVTVSHIHEGAEGVDGGVVVDLDLDGFESTSEGCTEGVDAAQLQAIIDDPAGFYVNVHNADFPAGAIRGQLSATTPDTALPSGGVPIGLIGLALFAMAGALAVTFRARGAHITNG